MSPKAVAPTVARRGLLRLGLGAGVGSALLPFLPFLESDAEAAGFPRRLLLYYIPMGPRIREWRPSGTETSFTLSRTLAPLQKYQSKLIVLDGMDNIAVKGGPANPGHPSIACLFTGAPNVSREGFADGPSVDQVIAAEISKVAPTPVSSIETGFNLDADVFSRMSFKASNQPVPPLEDPVAVHAKLFADFKISPAKLTAIQATRRSVIDTVKGELERAKARIPALDRPKLEAHLTNLRAIEARLSIAVGTCDKVPAAATAKSSAPGLLDSFGTLIAAAFSCNVTRVASILAGKEQGGLGGGATFLNLGTSEGHHRISHLLDPVGYEALNKINTWYYDQLRIIMDKLSAVPEGSGTMLDNTLIVCASPMGDPAAHSPRNNPVVLAGSCGGALKTGRYLKPSSQPMNNLLISICNAMGFPVTSFGDKRYSMGPLPGLV